MNYLVSKVNDVNFVNINLIFRTFLYETVIISGNTYNGKKQSDDFIGIDKVDDISLKCLG